MSADRLRRILRASPGTEAFFTAQRRAPFAAVIAAPHMAYWEVLTALPLLVPKPFPEFGVIFRPRIGEYVDAVKDLGLEAQAARFADVFNLAMWIGMIAVALCFVGTIGFVGLVGPHIARLLVGEQHRYFLPASTLCGALMLSLASIASKSLIPGLIVPIGIVTALVGVPAFMLLILGRRAAA